MIIEIIAAILAAVFIIKFWRGLIRFSLVGVMLIGLTAGGIYAYDQAEAESTRVYCSVQANKLKASGENPFKVFVEDPRCKN